MRDAARVVRAAMRDASGYHTHKLTTTASMNHLPSFHVVDEERDYFASRCGRLLVEETVEDAADVAASLRCQRPGCKQGWPS